MTIIDYGTYLTKQTLTFVGFMLICEILWQNEHYVHVMINIILAAVLIMYNKAAYTGNLGEQKFEPFNELQIDEPDNGGE